MTGTAAVFKKAGKTAAQPFDFEKAVAEAYELFPQIKGSVFFVDVDAGKAVHSDPAMRASLISAVNANDKMRAGLNLQIHQHKQQKASSVMELKNGRSTAYFVFLYLKKDMQSALGEKHDLAENMHLVFDHELAHAVLKQAHGAKLLSESTADAYAALRHFQRYGTENSTIEKLMKRRAALGFLNQDGAHFTSPALEKVLSKKKEIDFKALSPAETAELAQRLARSGSIKPDALKKLSRHFNQFKKPMRKVKNDKPLRQLAKVVFSARSPDLKKWGAVALTAFLDKDIALKTRTKKVRLAGPYWEKTRARINAGPGA